MRKYIALLILIVLFSCNQEEVTYQPSYIETKSNLVLLKHHNAIDNSWIRKPENILSVHETFKKIGYKVLLLNLDISRSPFLAKGIYVNRSLTNTIDSLTLTYPNYKEAPKYFNEFWQRRIVENNDSIVYEVLKEMKSILLLEDEVSFKEDLINDTLFTLLSYEYPRKELTENELNNYVDELIYYGLHQSAYNLIIGEHNSEVLTNQFEKIKNLNLVHTSLDFHPWLIDNTP